MNGITNKRDPIILLPPPTSPSIGDGFNWAFDFCEHVSALILLANLPSILPMSVVNGVEFEHFNRVIEHFNMGFLGSSKLSQEFIF